MNKNITFNFKNYKNNPWVLLFLLTILFNLILWFSMGDVWATKRSEIKAFKIENTKIEEKNLLLAEKITTHDQIIKEKGTEIKKKTDMEYPTSIDKGEISNALETYSLLTQEDIVLEFSSVRNIYIKDIKFPTDTKPEELQDGTIVMSTRVSISLEGEENTFKDLIKYLRNHEIPCEMKRLLKDGENDKEIMEGCPSHISSQTVTLDKNASLIEQKSYQYAKEKASQIHRYKIPVMLIDSIKMSRKNNTNLALIKSLIDEEQDITIGDYFDITIEGRFFSRTEEQIEEENNLEEQKGDGVSNPT